MIAANETDLNGEASILALLALALDPIEPPLEVRANLLRKVSVAPRLREVRASDGWRPYGIPGIQVKHLSLDKSRGIATFLMDLAPGTALPDHGHSSAEECYVLDGSAEIGGRTFQAGDFLHTDAGARHGDIVSASGVRVLLVVSSDDYLQSA